MNRTFEIFFAFLKLGCYAFGGPAAHIGYFKHTFVEKYRWLSIEQYGQLVGLSQFLPGPGSSQVGFSIGYHRGGLLGAIAAFIGFTLPSVILMLVFAMVADKFSGGSVFSGVVHGLKLLAVVVVADAAWGMFKSFCQQKLTAGLCIFTAVALLIMPAVSTQIVILLLSAIIGWHYLVDKSLETQKVNITKQLAWQPLLLFIVLLVSLPLLGELNNEWQIFSDFFQAGTLVFGGGHVVLPLLDGLVGDQISSDVFLTGYASAQAVPGPMFTFATFLGFELQPQAPVLGALIATLAIFLPGFLLILVVLKSWHHIAAIPRVAGAVYGVNAAVVGLLLSALYQPVFQSAVFGAQDMALVLVGGYCLKVLKLPIVALVLGYSLLGVIL